MSLIKIGGGVTLRPWQKKVMRAFDNGKRWVVLCVSRRAGKSLFAWNLLIREAINKPGTYWYCFDNYSTAYKAIWVAMTSKSIRFLDMIPKDLVLSMNSAKLEIKLTNGSVITLVGINKADKLVGAGLQGVVFDEYAVLSPNSIEFISAMLGETGGWRVMISTPRGKNHFYEQFNFAKAHPEFAYTLQMHCGMPEIAQYMAPGFLDQERLQIINKYGNDALFQQEYMTSWISPNSGSVFGALTKIMKDEGRVAPITPDRERPFYAAWDLGNCLDGDNEVLTPDGWVNIKELPNRIAVWRDGIATFEKVEGFSGYQHDAIHLNGAHIDIKVSPNHKMMIFDGHREREVAAADIKPHYRIVKGSKMAETEVDVMDLVNIMVQADGTIIHKDRQDGWFRLNLKKDRKKVRARELLQMAGIEFSETEKDTGYSEFYFKLDDSRNWKTLDGVRSNTQENIDELVKWDGHFSRGNTYVYNSTDRGCADKVHAMATMMGYVPFIKKYEKHHTSKGKKPIHRVTWSIRPKARYISLKSVERIEFNDYVYCYKTHAGWFLARDKNGNIFVSGNADYTSIVLFQVDENGFPHVYDHIENRNEDTSWYVGEMIERGWDVHTHFLPHDAAHRKGARNETYKQVLATDHGIRNTIVLNKPHRVEDKLNYLRRVFIGLHIDERLERLVECLDKLEYEWNEKQHIWSSKPTHVGGYSDTVDSLCYMAQAIQKYGITAKNAFSTAHVRVAEPILETKEAKKERLQKLLQDELTLGGRKKQTDSISLFI